MKCLVVLALALLVVANAHRHWGRPKPRPWGGKPTSVCAGTNPCGSIYKYREKVVKAGVDCPDSPYGPYGREDSDSETDLETESEESSEEDRHRHGGGHGGHGGYGGHWDYGGGIYINPNRFCVCLPLQIFLKNLL